MVAGVAAQKSFIFTRFRVRRLRRSRLRSMPEPVKSCPPPALALGLAPRCLLLSLVSHALGVPSPRRSPCPPPSCPRPSSPSRKKTMFRGRARPCRQPHRRQPALHAFPRQRQQPQQHRSLSPKHGIKQAQVQRPLRAGHALRSGCWHCCVESVRVCSGVSHL